MNNRKYLLIDNIHQLGKFCLHFGGTYDHPLYSCLRPVFKVENFKKQSHYDLLTGFLSIEKKFHECPLSILFTQIDSIKIREDGEKKYVSSSLLIFSKDYQNQREIKVNLESQRVLSGVVNEMYLNSIINTLNQYVELGNDINLINDEHFNNKDFFWKKKKNDILKIINDLNFSFESKSRSRVGKDTKYWEEVEISNLPKSTYIKSKILEILSKNRHFYMIESNENIIHLKFDSDSITSHFLKDILKLKILIDFDLDIELIERLKN